ncbi:MAG: SBBP repeat-containing protein, partial [Chloroflexi bacterium]|nr:SBBP repeat-containing protein [Chloroflexota bacterium]
LDDQGNLIVHIAGGEVIQRAPVIYQEVGGARQEISGGYALQGEGRVGFQVAAYDASRPLVIDPVLEYSSYLGGSDRDQGHGIAVDGAGNAYVTGETHSDNFPTTAGSFQPTAGGSIDAFVTKFSADGSTLVYSTYLGGSGIDVAYAIAVDAAGNAYVTGLASTGFPTTPGSFQTEHAGGTDAFVAKLNAAGSTLVYSTFLGGGGYDQTWGIAVGGDGSAYVTGSTLKPGDDFPVTPGAFQPSRGGPDPAAFVTKFNPTGSALEYSTHLGGSETDSGYDIAVDTDGNAYVTGPTGSDDFPVTAGVFQTGLAGPADVFVTKLNAGGSALVYSTYLGGSTTGGVETGFGIAVDAAGSAYVTGETQSDDFPTTAGSFQPTRGGFRDAFVTKLNADGSALDYSSFLGGSNVEHGAAIAVDAEGNAYATGWTASTDFPTVNPLLGSGYENGEVYVAKVNAAGSALVYSTYLGGSDLDRVGGDAGDPEGNNIAADAEGCAFVTGRTRSTDFPTTAGAFQASFGGGFNDAFVAKICPGAFIYLPLVVK